MNKGKVLTKKDLNKVVVRWMLMAVNTFNFQTQQAGSMVFSMAPALRKIYQDDKEYQESLENHFSYYNCMPWLSPLVMGATLAIEENGGIQDKEIVKNIKTSLMGPLSGVGDSIFWVLIPTILGSIAGYMGQQFSPVGVVAWMMINVAFMFMRVKMIHLGYHQGTKLVTSFGDKVALLTECASILGLVVVGSLVPSVIGVKVPLVVQYGEVAMEIQPLLDKILPSLVPAVITYILYKLLSKKKLGPTGTIFAVIGFSMLGAVTGFLG